MHHFIHISLTFLVSLETGIFLKKFFGFEPCLAAQHEFVMTAVKTLTKHDAHTAPVRNAEIETENLS